MTRRASTRRLCQTGTALLLALGLATEVAAASWAYPVPLTSSGDADGVALVTLEPSTVVLVYTESGTGRVRRSTDGGASWESAGQVPGTFHQVAGLGNSLDLAWLGAGRVRYARSTNGGVTFGSAIALSSTSDVPSFPAIARGPNNRVVVAWLAQGSGGWDIKVRVSTTGGASFASAKTIATNVSGSPGVAVGSGVLYVSYRNDGLYVRRSTNSGSTWSPPKLVASDAYGDPVHRVSMTAQGSRAYVAYVAGEGPEPIWVRYVKTSDKGLTWSAPRNLAPRADMAPRLRSDHPSISLQNGIVRAVFARCLSSPCDTTGVFYRQSSGGTTWTSAYPVSVAVDTPWVWDPAVGFALRTVVAYVGVPEPALSDAYVRTRQ